MRESFRVIIAAVAALASATILSGCTPAQTGSATTGTPPAPAARPKQITQTIYFVSGNDGSKKYLTAGDPLVAAVTDVVTRQSEATDNRDANGIVFSSEYKYYTPELASRLEAEQNTVLNFYRTNQLATKHIGIFWFEVSFDPSLKKSTVRMTDQFVYNRASAAYYAKAKLRPATVVSQDRLYSLSLVDGDWTITGIDASKETVQPNNGLGPVGH